MSKFIVVEGIDGSGKSTIIPYIVEMLKDKNAVSVVEPNDFVREILKKEKIRSKTELLLMYASRNEVIQNEIKPALENGQWVVADRHSLSSFAYQGSRKDIEEKEIQILNDMIVGDLEPDLTIYLDTSAVVGAQRAIRRGNLDGIEMESLEFFEEVRRKYLNFASQSDKIEVVSSMCQISFVKSQIKNIIRRRMLGEEEG